MDIARNHFVLKHDLASERLLLRSWATEDIGPFSASNADPDTMRYYPTSVLSEDESRVRAKAIEEYYKDPGFRHWVIEEKNTGSFAGVIGLKPVAFEAHFVPAVEIGWRLVRSHWGKGFATEAARAVFQHGFTTCRLSEIVAFTAVINERSQALMERLGMTTDPEDDFLHPEMPDGHELKPHVLFRIRKEGFPAG